MPEIAYVIYCSGQQEINRTCLARLSIPCRHEASGCKRRKETKEMVSNVFGILGRKNPLMIVTRRYFFEYPTCKYSGEVLERKYLALGKNPFCWGKILKEL